MKYSILAVAGSIGMGLSILAASLGESYSNGTAEFYAGTGFAVMLIGTFGIICPPLREWWTKRKRGGAVRQPNHPDQ